MIINRDKNVVVKSASGTRKFAMLCKTIDTGGIAHDKTIHGNKREGASECNDEAGKLKRRHIVISSQLGRSKPSTCAYACVEDDVADSVIAPFDSANYFADRTSMTPKREEQILCGVRTMEIKGYGGNREYSSRDRKARRAESMRELRKSRKPRKPRKPRKLPKPQNPCEPQTPYKHKTRTTKIGPKLDSVHKSGGKDRRDRIPKQRRRSSKSRNLYLDKSHRKKS